MDESTTHNLFFNAKNMTWQVKPMAAFLIFTGCFLQSSRGWYSWPAGLVVTLEPVCVCSLGVRYALSLSWAASSPYS